VKREPMNDESSLVIRPSLDLDETQYSDQAITGLNQSWGKLYFERRQKVIHLLRQVPSIIEAVKSVQAGKSYRVVIPSCAECGRPLQEGEEKYCPNCLAERAKKMRNVTGVLGAIGTVAVAATGIAIKIIKTVAGDREG